MDKSISSKRLLTRDKTYMQDHLIRIESVHFGAQLGMSTIIKASVDSIH